MVSEKTLKQWKAWFVEERGVEPTIANGLGRDVADNENLQRLWLSSDGKPEPGIPPVRGKVWFGRGKGRKPSRGLLLLCGEEVSPLVLTLPNRGKQDGGRDGSSKPKSAPLKPPFQWRCRRCGEGFTAYNPKIHCGRSPRQLAPVSEEGKAWFESYLSKTEWKYVPHQEAVGKLDYILNDAEANEVVNKAGESLEAILQGADLQVPEHFELYNVQTDNLRVSDLKERSKFASVLKKIVGWRKRKMKPKRSAPLGDIEKGHIFDELLTNTFSNLNTDSWSKGSRVSFHSDELGVTVAGTPDLGFMGIPVETKTSNILPCDPDVSKKMRMFRKKWHHNYTKQVALYLQGSENDWMMLLIISRTTGSFTVVPMTDGAIYPLRDEWRSWLEDSKIAEGLEAYKRDLAEEE